MVLGIVGMVDDTQCSILMRSRKNMNLSGGQQKLSKAKRRLLHRGNFYVEIKQLIFPLQNGKRSAFVGPKRTNEVAHSLCANTKSTPSWWTAAGVDPGSFRSLVLRGIVPSITLGAPLHHQCTISCCQLWAT